MKVADAITYCLLCNFLLFRTIEKHFCIVPVEKIFGLDIYCWASFTKEVFEVAFSCFPDTENICNLIWRGIYGLRHPYVSIHISCGGAYFTIKGKTRSFQVNPSSLEIMHIPWLGQGIIFKL